MSKQIWEYPKPYSSIEFKRRTNYFVLWFKSITIDYLNLRVIFRFVHHLCKVMQITSHWIFAAFWGGLRNNPPHAWSVQQPS